MSRTEPPRARFPSRITHKFHQRTYPSSSASLRPASNAEGERGAPLLGFQPRDNFPINDRRARADRLWITRAICFADPLDRRVTCFSMHLPRPVPISSLPLSLGFIVQQPLVAARYRRPVAAGKYGKLATVYERCSWH